MHVYPQLLLIFFNFFSSQSVRMSGNSINFNDKKIKKATSTKTKKYLI